MACIRQFHTLILYFSIAFKFTFSFPTLPRALESLPKESFNETLNIQQAHAVASYPLPKRITPEYDDDYEASALKGYRFICRCKNPFLGNDQSQYTTPEILHNSGWTRRDNFELQTNAILTALEDAFETLDITDYSQAQGVQWTNDVPSVNEGGNNAPASGAFFSNVYDPEAGFIIAAANYGPAYMYEGTLELHQFPTVKAWSDVVFTEWKTQAQDLQADIKNLKFIFRYDILNSESKNIIRESVVPEDDLDWPGVVIPMDQEEGQAILGSPNGRGIAWLLASHKLALGLKTINNVWAWREGVFYYAVFEIEDVPDGDDER